MIDQNGFEEETLAEVAGPVPADYNNARQDGTIDLPRKWFPRVESGTPVIITDPGDDLRYTATVVSMDDQNVTLTVDWTSPIEVVDPETDVW